VLSERQAIRLNRSAANLTLLHVKGSADRLGKSGSDLLVLMTVADEYLRVRKSGGLGLDGGQMCLNSSVDLVDQRLFVASLRIVRRQNECVVRVTRSPI